MMTTSAAGPIAKKILHQVSKLKAQRVVDLAARRQGRDEMARIFREAVPSDDARAEEPAFAAYTYVTNWALLTDLKLILRTLPAVARRSHAY